MSFPDGHSLTALLLASMLSFGPQSGQDPVETKYPSGHLHERFTLDAAGRKSGAYEEFREDGTLAQRCLFKSDKRDGRAEEFFADGKTVQSSGDYAQGEREGAWLFVADGQKRRKKVEYKKGIVNGAVSIEIDGRVASKQRWKDGELERLDDLVPFPARRAALLDKLHMILSPPPMGISTAKDPLAAERAAALRRLQAYRALCGVPYESMSLVPAWNDLCDAASEVNKLNGQISHTPAKPPGFDEARFKQACEGASHSNLSQGTDLAGSVDSYMNDSDDSNIARIGHRRWCLNPLMGKTAFGADGTFSAMWSMDESGKGPRGLDAVLYPPPGWCPLNMFSADRAFSISPLKGGQVKKADLKVKVHALDEDWVAGDELKFDHMDSIESGFGSGGCLVFRPEGLKVSVDARYLVDVSTDGGRTIQWRYVVAFCEPAQLD
jgi:hypothetical protein